MTTCCGCNEANIVICSLWMHKSHQDEFKDALVCHSSLKDILPYIYSMLKRPWILKNSVNVMYSEYRSYICKQNMSVFCKHTFFPTSGTAKFENTLPVKIHPCHHALSIAWQFSPTWTVCVNGEIHRDSSPMEADRNSQQKFAATTTTTTTTITATTSTKNNHDRNKKNKNKNDSWGTSPQLVPLKVFVVQLQMQWSKFQCTRTLWSQFCLRYLGWIKSWKVAQRSP